ncbi:MAG: hypothetical protein ACHQ52_04995 [Candidatus Eisenbacteria bacterium]
MLRRSISTALLLSGFLGTITLHAAFAGGLLSTSATCPDGQHFVVTWDWSEYSPTPPYPEWVGYDILRHVSGSCDPFVRVNPESFPRLAAGQSETFTEPAPALLTTYEYRVVPVDASHQQVILSSVDCNPPCVQSVWVSCPQGSAPLTFATVVDWGWTVFLQPCTGSCWPSFYVGNSPMALELRAYIGTGQVFEFFGDAACGSVEGCSINVTHYDLAGCGPTPTERPSWGRVKTIYR